MKRLNRIFGILMGCALLCLFPPARILGFEGEPARIKPIELKRLIDSEEKVVVVDVRGEKSYREVHIPDALSIPLAQIAMRHTELPKKGLIVFY